jgi:4'-phosphopantetheinyl transferase
LKPTGEWTTPAFVPPLLSGEVHLWRTLVPDAELVPPHWPGLLTAEEQARAARKRLPVDARRTLASRANLRLLLGCYLELPPASVALAINAHGKPQLASPSAPGTLEFNVSHSGDWIVLAFARGLPLGVDVECCRDLDFNELVNSAFSPQERETWSRLPSAEHARAFFSAWTRKEAYLKALGLGLSKSLDSFTVTFDFDSGSGLIWCASDASAPPRWQITSVELAPGYACALAVSSAATELKTFTFAPFPHPFCPG